MPRILKSNRNETYDQDVLREMGSMGMLGPTLQVITYQKISHKSNLIICRVMDVLV
jgi:hypothetical protein